jgi:hypothetical protein
VNRLNRLRFASEGHFCSSHSPSLFDQESSERKRGETSFALDFTSGRFTESIKVRYELEEIAEQNQSTCYSAQAQFAFWSCTVTTRQLSLWSSFSSRHVVALRIVGRNRPRSPSSQAENAFKSIALLNAFFCCRAQIDYDLEHATSGDDVNRSFDSRSRFGTIICSLPALFSLSITHFKFGHLPAPTDFSPPLFTTRSLKCSNLKANVIRNRRLK